MNLQRMPATRIVAIPAALDATNWPVTALVLRTAADEVSIMPPPAELKLADPHAIVAAEGSLAGAWVPANTALAFLERACEWEVPPARPAFAQGTVAGVPTKLWLEQERVLFVIPAPYIEDFQERWLL